MKIDWYHRAIALRRQRDLMVTREDWNTLNRLALICDERHILDTLQQLTTISECRETSAALIDEVLKEGVDFYA